MMRYMKHDIQIESKIPLKMRFDMNDVYVWLGAVVGLMAGGIAYINGISFMRLPIGGIIESALAGAWGILIAFATPVAGMMGKYFFDKKLKPWLDKRFKKRNRNTP
jgi:hypothetical protein